MHALLPVALMLLTACGGGGECRPQALGSLAIGQRADSGAIAKCEPAGASECTYRDADGVEYVLRKGIVVQKTAPAERVLAAPLRGPTIDQAMVDDLAGRFCTPFTLKRDDAGRAYAESAERTDRGDAYPYRTLLYPADEEGGARVVVTTLPEN